MKYSIVASIIVSSVFMIGCAKKIDIKPKNLADSVDQHVVTGLNELENGRIKNARTNFLAAQALNHSASSPLSSLALVSSDSKELLSEAKSNSETNLDKLRYEIATIRTANNDEDFQSIYKEISELKVGFMPYYHDKGSVDYYIGKYYYKKLDFKNASRYFENVFQKYEHSKFENRARVLWKKSDAITRALSLSKWSVTTKKIATLDAISRADAAVVLVTELNLDKLLKGSFNRVKKDADRATPSDIISHPNFVELNVINKYGLRGLEPIVKDGKLVFAPNKPITRADFAFILEDIVAKLKHDDSIKRKYIGSVSPFSDVTSHDAIFNASLDSVSMGFLTPTKYKEFRPNDTLTGVELIQAIAKIKEEISL